METRRQCCSLKRKSKTPHVSTPLVYHARAKHHLMLGKVATVHVRELKLDTNHQEKLLNETWCSFINRVSQKNNVLYGVGSSPAALATKWGGVYFSISGGIFINVGHKHWSGSLLSLFSPSHLWRIFVSRPLKLVFCQPFQSDILTFFGALPADTRPWELRSFSSDRQPCKAATSIASRGPNFARVRQKSYKSMATARVEPATLQWQVLHAPLC